MNQENSYHQPVMLAESMSGLSIKPDGIYVDLTFGGGGHAKNILAQLTSGHLFAFDRDVDAANLGRRITHPSFTFIRAPFRFLQRFLSFYGIEQVDGFLADLGTSSHQINTATRGFSTRFNGVLDMRMDRSTTCTALEIINTYTEEQLALLFKNYAEVRFATTIAKRIIAARELNPITTTVMLKEIIAPLSPAKREDQYFAKVFQSLRIEVNDELGELKYMLQQANNMLKKGGRLVVISYHSLEDSLAKNFIHTGDFLGNLAKDIYGNSHTPFIPLHRKPITPSEKEIADNKRARSAKLRVGVRQ